MDLIHDRANKFINDVCKKKVKSGRNVYKANTGQVKQDSSPNLDLTNSCLYCEKIFYNSRFLLSHVLRRHSEQLLLLCKKGLKHDSFLEREFGLLKNELKIIKQAITNKNVENDTENSKDNISIESQQKVCIVSENTKTNADETEIHLNEIKFLKDKMDNLETNYQYLCNAFKELENILKSDVLMKQDMKEHIDMNNEKVLRVQESQLHELRKSLLRDLQIVLSKQLSDNNIELKSQISELKYQMKQFDIAIGEIKKQVDSPDYMNSIVEKYEQQLHLIARSMRYKRRISKNLPSKPDKSSLCHLTADKVPDCNKMSKKVLPLRKNKHIPIMPCTSQNEVSNLLNEKLSHFGISPNSSKISHAEFEEKVKLINLEKEHLNKIPNFSKIYSRINSHADHKAHLKLIDKKSRKVKFLEPSTAFNNSLSSDEKFKNKPCLKETLCSTSINNQKLSDYENQELTNFKMCEREGFISTDINGGGDYSQTYLDNQSHYLEEQSTFNKSEFKTSATVKDTLNSQKNENQKHAFQQDPLSVESVSDFKTNSVFLDTQESEKSCGHTENYLVNSVASCSKEIVGKNTVEMQKNLDYIFKDYLEESFGKKENCNYNSDESDNEDSLESLSSWED